MDLKQWLIPGNLYRWSSRCNFLDDYTELYSKIDGLKKIERIYDGDIVMFLELNHTTIPSIEELTEAQELELDEQGKKMVDMFRNSYSIKLLYKNKIGCIPRVHQRIFSIIFNPI